MQTTIQNQTEQNFFDIIFTIFESKEIIAFTMLVGIIFLFTNYSGMLHYIHPDNEKVLVYEEVIRMVISHFDSLFFSLTTCIIIFQSKGQLTKILFCFFESSFLFLNLGRDKITTLMELTETDAKLCLVTYVSIFSGFAFFYLGMLAKMHRNKATTPTTAPPLINAEAPKEEQPQNTPLPSPITKSETRTIVKGLFNADELPKNEIHNHTDELPKDEIHNKEIYDILNNIPHIMKLNNKTEDTTQQPPQVEKKKQVVKLN